MEKRIIGLILTLAGVAGIILAGYHVMQGTGDFRAVAIYGIIGLIFFIAGVGLIRSTKDKPA